MLVNVFLLGIFIMVFLSAVRMAVRCLQNSWLQPFVPAAKVVVEAELHRACVALRYLEQVGVNKLVGILLSDTPNTDTEKKLCCYFCSVQVCIVHLHMRSS